VQELRKIKLFQFTADFLKQPD